MVATTTVALAALGGFGGWAALSIDASTAHAARESQLGEAYGKARYAVARLELAVREDQPMVIQCIAFATFSLIVKYAEQLLFGTWELDHFFHVFHGNVAYVLGWSLADALYPPITFYGLRLLGRWVPGLIVL